MFNSPLHYCTLCREYVELDQSQADCAREHGCTSEACPLKAYFLDEQPSRPNVDAGREPPTPAPPEPGSG
jgi:hypothetical protein